MWKYVTMIVVWWIFFHLFVKEPLLSLSLQNMPQEKPTQAVIMKILSEMGDKNGMGVVILLTKHFRPDREAFTVLIVLCFASLLNSVDKMFWSEGRPYFLTKVAPLDCHDIEFG
jgi:hypothetical protein